MWIKQSPPASQPTFGTTWHSTAEDCLPSDSGCAHNTLTKVPTSTDSVFFPAIPAKKGTSMYVEYVGVTKLEKPIF